MGRMVRGAGPVRRSIDRPVTPATRAAATGAMNGLLYIVLYGALLFITWAWVFWLTQAFMEAVT